MMSYSKIIHQYLDTGVDGSTEEMLFAKLAGDEALRSEFNRQVQLHLIAQNDMNSISPPMDVTSGIFKSLGFEIPTHEFNSNIREKAAAGSVSSANGPLMAFWKKHLSTIIVAVIASLITAGVFYTTQEFGAGFGDNRNNAGQAHNSESSMSGIPVISSFEDADSRQAKEFAALSGPDKKSGNSNMNSLNDGSFSNNSHNTLHNNSSSGIKDHFSRNNNSGNNNSSQDSQSDSFGSSQPDSDGQFSDDQSSGVNNWQHVIEISSTNYAYSYGNGQSPADALGIKDPASLAQNSYNPYGLSTISIPPDARRNSLFDNLVDNIDNTQWAVSVRGVSASDPASFNNRLANSNYWLDNANVEVLYKIDQYWGISVDFGRENISQVFTGTISGKAYDFAQNPALYWYGVSGLLRLPDFAIVSGVVPYAKVTLGGTTIGAIGKFQAGLQIRFYKNVRFIVAGEATGLLYNVDGTSYTTGKSGLTYGISYGF